MTNPRPTASSPRTDPGRAFRSTLDLILLYHRVAETASDPQLLAVSPENFAEQLAALRHHFEIVPLARIGEESTADSMRRPRVALTFDDGYLDNLLFAKPILENADAPATVFAASGYTDTQREFWWDELERLVLSPQTRTRSLSLRISGEQFTLDAADEAEISGAAERNLEGWNVTRSDDPTPRHRAYRELFARLRPLPQEDRRRVLDELEAIGPRRMRKAEHGMRKEVRSDHKGQEDSLGKEPAGLTASSSPQAMGGSRLIRQPSLAAPRSAIGPTSSAALEVPRRPMSPEELVELIDGGLIDVGSHTVTHPVLSALSIDEQALELRESKRRLEEILGRPVETFSYPFGTRRDYSDTTVALVNASGYALACSNFEPRGSGGEQEEATGDARRTTGVGSRGTMETRDVRPGNREKGNRGVPGGSARLRDATSPYADRLQLPRVLVRDWNGETLLRHLLEVVARA